MIILLIFIIHLILLYTNNIHRKINSKSIKGLHVRAKNIKPIEENGKEIQKRRDKCICIADSLCYIVETNTTL